MMVATLAQNARVVQLTPTLTAASILMGLLEILSRDDLAGVEDVYPQAALHVANTLSGFGIASLGLASHFLESSVHGYPPLPSKDSISGEAVKSSSLSDKNGRLTGGHVFLVTYKFDATFHKRRLMLVAVEIQMGMSWDKSNPNFLKSKQDS
jgi:hypothetical protein